MTIVFLGNLVRLEALCYGGLCLPNLTATAEAVVVDPQLTQVLKSLVKAKAAKIKAIQMRSPLSYS